MGQQHSVKKDEPLDVQAVWEYENKLTVEERRKRYSCGSKFIEASKIPSWDQQVENILKQSPLKRKEEAKQLQKCKSKLEHLENQLEELLKNEPKPNENEENTNEESKKKTEITKEDRARMKLKREIKEVKTNITMLDGTALKNSYSHSDVINKKIALIRCDITKLEVDAIVNAANKFIQLGAIHRSAGSKLLHECITLNGANTGETKITRGYNLPAKVHL